VQPQPTVVIMKVFFLFFVNLVENA